MGFPRAAMATDIARSIIFKKNASNLYDHSSCRSLPIDSAWLRSMVAVPGWLILEPQTGLRDGTYNEESKALDTLSMWNDRRPEYEHVLVEEENSSLRVFLDLPVQHLRESRKKREELKEFEDFKELKEFKEFRTFKNSHDPGEAEIFKELRVIKNIK